MGDELKYYEAGRYIFLAGCRPDQIPTPAEIGYEVRRALEQLPELNDTLKLTVGVIQNRFSKLLPPGALYVHAHVKAPAEAGRG